MESLRVFGTAAANTAADIFGQVDATKLALAAVPLALPIAYYATTRKAIKPSSGPKPDGPEVIIIGGGVLGASLAAVLGRDGRKVLLVERDFAEPDRIVGELLQPGGYRAMKELGLAEAADNIDAVREDGYIVYYGDRAVHLNYPLDPETGKQHAGVSFHHGKFVMNLRAAAKTSPNVTCLEATVTQLIHEEGTQKVIGVRYRTKSGEEGEEKAPLTVVADGCFSKFRKELVKNQVKVSSKFYGLVMKDAPLQFPHRALVCLINPCPVLVYQIGTHDTRVLVDLPEDAGITDVLAYMKETVAPQMPEYIRPAFLAAVESDRLRSMPNSYLPAAPVVRPGVICLGDALNMRHPLTGGGMTVVFKDVLMWRQYIAKIDDLRDTDAIVTAYKDFQVSRKNGHSFVINVLANALYSLFAASDERLAVLREGCFKYFELGGECVDGPVSLLSALQPKPMTLISHFFSVALYGMYDQVTSNGLLAMPVKAVQSVFVLKSACTVIFPLIWQEAKHAYVK